MKKSFDVIDLAKFIGSILVFAMHCGALDDCGTLSILPQMLARWGVPFFFVCSAYFLFRDNTDGRISKEAIRKYLFRIAALYAVWFIYNIPNVYYMRLYSKDLTSFTTWLVFLKDSVLASTFTGSWYLASSLFSAWFVYTLSKKLPTKTILKITSVFYLLCVLTSAYKGILPSSAAEAVVFLCFPLNIFNGCFYFSLGKYIAENQQTVTEIIDRKRALIGFAVFYALFAAEIFVTKHFGIFGSTDVTFSTVFMAVSLFLFCLQASAQISCAPVLRKLSTVIYCCQGNVLLVNVFLRKILHIPSVPAFLISAAVEAVICLAVLFIQKHKNWKWSSYLT